MRKSWNGVFELRIHFGRDGVEMLWLLYGGDKSTQNHDIKKAKSFWEDCKNAKK